MLYKKYKKPIMITALSLFTLIYSFAIFKIGVYYGKGVKEYTFQNTESVRYIIKEHNDTIAVFEYGSDIPQRILNIEVSGLRRHDRLRFKEGIVINSSNELAQLEEDFCN